MTDLQKKISRLGVIVVGCILVVLFIIQGIGMYTTYRNTVAKAEQDIVDAQKEILMQNAILEESEQSRLEAEGNIHSMGDDDNNAGVIVATLMNQYARESDTYRDTQLGELDSVSDEIMRIRNRLDGYFPDDDIYLWYDWDYSHMSISWMCETNYKFRGTSFDVLWLCTDSSHSDVYAYATATYDANTNTFSNLKTGVTSIGLQYLIRSGDSEE